MTDTTTVPTAAPSGAADPPHQSPAPVEPIDWHARFLRAQATIAALLAERAATMRAFRDLFVSVPEVPWRVIHHSDEPDRHVAWIAARQRLAAWDAAYPPEQPLGVPVGNVTLAPATAGQ